MKDELLVRYEDYGIFTISDPIVLEFLCGGTNVGCAEGTNVACPNACDATDGVCPTVGVPGNVACIGGLNTVCPPPLPQLGCTAPDAMCSNVKCWSNQGCPLP